jgi:SAM-dependent methyltransferase
LDIGSENGSNIAFLLNGSAIGPSNVYIADISDAAIAQGNKRYGFRPVRIPESGALPFEDQYFDIVYCSSVIEHVTVPKSLVWSMLDGRTFKELAWTRQQEFAREIRRLGKRYFVQTPCKSFPVESHTWLPLVGYLPRRVLVPFLRISNKCWPKRTAPDWNLLSAGDMRLLFPDADIVEEKFWGLRKSIMAIRR